MEIFYTFLKPVILEVNGVQYFCWGYREVDNEVVSFSATKNQNDNWVYANYFTDAQLVSEFKKLLPEKPVKRKRRKRE